MILAWLDHFIDSIHDSGSSSGSFGWIGSLFNLTICGLGTVGATVNAVINGGYAWLLVVGLVLLEILFVRIAFRVRRGDFIPR